MSSDYFHGDLAIAREDGERQRGIGAVYVYSRERGKIMKTSVASGFFPGRSPQLTQTHVASIPELNSPALVVGWVWKCYAEVPQSAFRGGTNPSPLLHPSIWNANVLNGAPCPQWGSRLPLWTVEPRAGGIWGLWGHYRVQLPCELQDTYTDFICLGGEYSGVLFCSLTFGFPCPF